MLKGKTALVTGSTSCGIGLGHRHAALQGARRKIVSEGLRRLRRYRKAARRNGRKSTGAVRYDGADLSPRKPIESVLARSLAESGSATCCVNNAGHPARRADDQFPVEKWNAIIGSN